MAPIKINLPLHLPLPNISSQKYNMPIAMKENVYGFPIQHRL